MEYVMRYSLEAKKETAFRRWLEANEQRLRDESPKAWTYLGTYFVVHATADYACETRWRLDDYAALEPAGESSAWRKLIQEHGSFVSGLPPMRTVLMKEASEVTIITSEES